MEAILSFLRMALPLQRIEARTKRGISRSHVRSRVMMEQRTTTQRKVKAANIHRRTPTRNRVHLDVVGSVVTRRRLILVFVLSLLGTRANAPAPGALMNSARSPLALSRVDARKKILRAALPVKSNAATPVTTAIASKMYHNGLNRKKEEENSKKELEPDRPNKKSNCYVVTHLQSIFASSN